MGVVGAVFFVFFIYYYFKYVSILLGVWQETEYSSDVYLADKSTIADLPRNIKSKTTTKMRWAKRTEPDNSFANAVMWADLGND
jgi:hypothetical protein